MSQRITIEYQGRAIGTLIEKGTETFFEKYVNPLKHFFRIYQAYGIQKVVFDKYLRNRKGKVIITERHGRILESQIGLWEKFGIENNFGDGSQIFLPVKYMSNLSNKQIKLWGR